MILDPRGHVLGQQDFREGPCETLAAGKADVGLQGFSLLECLKCIKNTLPETNIAHENGWLEY